MNGYLFESEALQEGRAALHRLQKRLGQIRDNQPK
jgi:hypothetical protein